MRVNINLMPETTETQGLSAQIAALLPALRRHARALTGNQETGDAFAMKALETILRNRDAVTDQASLQVDLFGVFFKAWDAQDTPVTADDDPTAMPAERYLSKLTPDSRHALLLHSIEQFSTAEIARIMGRTQNDVTALIDTAHGEIKQSIAGRILVIEDEAMIALDLQYIVEEMGHTVTGTAATHNQAIALARTEKPDLILSDIQLGDGSSGIDAVDEILSGVDDIPVIFITAFPELLLTGERREPAFVMTKPYSAEQVKSALSQAMFFRSSGDIRL